MRKESNVEDLQAVSQHMVASTERIRALEEEKRITDPASERFRALSDEVEGLAEEMRAMSHAETGLAEEVAGQPDLPTVAEADAQSHD